MEPKNQEQETITQTQGQVQQETPVVSQPDPSPASRGMSDMEKSQLDRIDKFLQQRNQLQDQLSEIDNQSLYTRSSQEEEKQPEERPRKKKRTSPYQDVKNDPEGQTEQLNSEFDWDVRAPSPDLRVVQREQRRERHLARQARKMNGSKSTDNSVDLQPDGRNFQKEKYISTQQNAKLNDLETNHSKKGSVKSGSKKATTPLRKSLQSLTLVQEPVLDRRNSDVVAKNKKSRRKKFRPGKSRQTEFSMSHGKINPVRSKSHSKSICRQLRTTISKKKKRSNRTGNGLDKSIFHKVKQVKYLDSQTSLDLKDQQDLQKSLIERGKHNPLQRDNASIISQQTDQTATSSMMEEENHHHNPSPLQQENTNALQIFPSSKQNALVAKIRKILLHQGVKHEQYSDDALEALALESASQKFLKSTQDLALNKRKEQMGLLTHTPFPKKQKIQTLDTKQFEDLNLENQLKYQLVGCLPQDIHFANSKIGRTLINKAKGIHRQPLKQVVVQKQRGSKMVNKKLNSLLQDLIDPADLLLNIKEGDLPHENLQKIVKKIACKKIAWRPSDGITDAILIFSVTRLRVATQFLLKTLEVIFPCLKTECFKGDQVEQLAHIKNASHNIIEEEFTLINSILEVDTKNDKLENRENKQKLFHKSLSARFKEYPTFKLDNILEMIGGVGDEIIQFPTLKHFTNMNLTRAQLKRLQNEAYTDKPQCIITAKQKPNKTPWRPKKKRKLDHQRDRKPYPKNPKYQHNRDNKPHPKNPHNPKNKKQDKNL